MKVDQNGNIYMADVEQLLKFSPDGKFIPNLITIGQGPGEIQDYFYYSLYKDEIYIYVPMIRKIVCLKKRNLPKRKFENDISGLFFNQKSRLLWIKTSTQSQEKGVLYDIFDEKGQYVDNFYLSLNGDLLAVKGDTIFVKETDEAGIISISKYRILEQKK